MISVAVANSNLEYFNQIVLVTYLVILGLAITNGVRHIAEIIKYRHESRPYFLHTFWSITLLIFLFQFAEHVWGFRQVSNWNQLHLLALMINPLLLYLATEILFPNYDGRSFVDVRFHYYHKRRWFFGILAVLPVANFVTDSFLLRDWSVGSYEFFSLVFIGIFIVLAMTERPVLHVVLSTINVPVFIIFSVLFSTNYADPDYRDRTNSAKTTKNTPVFVVNDARKIITD